MDTLSISPNLLNQLSFSSEELAAIRAIGEYRGKQELYAKQSPEILENLRTVAKIESSESSNRIEGIVVARNRVEDIINHPQVLLKNRSEQEVAGYRDALQLIHESAEYMPISSNLVLQLHSLICKYTPNPGGRWKATDNEIIETSSTGERKIRFKAISAVQTPHVMNDWEFFYRDTIQCIDPLIVVPLAILDFLCIHPFLDGNGRTSRLLTLLLLYKSDYQVGRYISLERVIEQSKESYYETLQKSSQGWHEGKQDVKPWLHYFWGILIKAYRELDEKVSDIKGGKGSKTEMIRQTVKSMIGPFSISDIQDKLPTVGRDMIKLVLADLKTEGLILLKGKGRGAKWVNGQRNKF
jgi:Fic family protein